MQTIEEDVGLRLIGQDPRYHTKIFAEVWKTTALNARRGILSIAPSAVDLALWDLVGKALQAPVYQLLGAFTDQVPCYASAGLYGKRQR